MSQARHSEAKIMHIASYGLKIIFGNVASYSHRYVTSSRLRNGVCYYLCCSHTRILPSFNVESITRLKFIKIGLAIYSLLMQFYKILFH